MVEDYEERLFRRSVKRTCISLGSVLAYLSISFYTNVDYYSDYALKFTKMGAEKGVSLENQRRLFEAADKCHKFAEVDWHNFVIGDCLFSSRNDYIKSIEDKTKN